MFPSRRRGLCRGTYLTCESSETRPCDHIPHPASSSRGDICRVLPEGSSARSYFTWWQLLGSSDDPDLRTQTSVNSVRPRGPAPGDTRCCSRRSARDGGQSAAAGKLCEGDSPQRLEENRNCLTFPVAFRLRGRVTPGEAGNAREEDRSRGRQSDQRDNHQEAVGARLLRGRRRRHHLVTGPTPGAR